MLTREQKSDNNQPVVVSSANPGPAQNWLVRVLGERSVQIALGIWLIATVALLLMNPATLPFDRPILKDQGFIAQLLTQQVQLLWVLFLMGATYLVTRHRTPPDLAKRAPARKVALKETVFLIFYGAFFYTLGQILGPILGMHPLGLHLPGTIFGTKQTVQPAEAFTWMIYNFVFYAVLPYFYFRSRGYSNEALNLKSVDRKGDFLLIAVILVLETLFELTITLPVFSQTPTQLLGGMALAFVFYWFGTVLPIMIFIYAILLPRYFKLTNNSVATTVILGGLSYASFHLFEFWTVYDSPYNAVLSFIFALFQFFGPGMIKSYLTLRSGNAWIHAVSYHAISPHTISDSVNLVRIFGIK